MNAREETIADCKYAKGLGATALSQHFVHWEWRYSSEISQEDREYQLTLLEIQSKLDTPECLLGEVK